MSMTLTPASQVNLQNIGVPAAGLVLPPNSIFRTPLQVLANMATVTVVATLSQAGTLELWEYTDTIGNAPLAGTPTTTAMAANTPTTLVGSTSFIGFSIGVVNLQSTPSTLTIQSVTIGYPYPL